MPQAGQQRSELTLTGHELTCRRGERPVFDRLSFAVSSGESLLLTGPNGAGKTSLLRIIAGLLRPVAGRLSLDGGGDLEIGQQAHFVGHLDAVKTPLSVQENLAFWSRFLGGAGAAAVARAMEAFDLAHLADIPAGMLSAGQRRRLGLARLFTAPRPLWLLDEPSVSLDAASRALLAGHMRGHIAAGGILVASTHGDLGVSFTHELALERHAAVDA